MVGPAKGIKPDSTISTISSIKVNRPNTVCDPHSTRGSFRIYPVFPDSQADLHWRWQPQLSSKINHAPKKRKTFFKTNN